VADSRHKHAAPQASPKNALFQRVALPTAGLLALGAVVTGVVVGGSDGSPTATTDVVRTSSDAGSSSSSVLAARSTRGNLSSGEISRSAERPPLPNVAQSEQQVEGLRYALTDISVHAGAKSSSPVLASVAKGETVDVTGKTRGDWAEVMHKGLPRWVSAKSLTTKMPLGTQPCAVGGGVERGLLPDTIKVFRAVCDRFPSIRSYGGVAGRGEHATGHALDIMVSSDLGNEIAAFLQQNRAELGIEYLIWRQRIWRPSTSAAWRGMSDRGGATANHFDHVHVTTYGNSASR
jgi:hypothetical protein